MIGAGEEKLQITKERYSGEDVSGPKHGKVDKNNEPHVGGNTWAGGTGGIFKEIMNRIKSKGKLHIVAKVLSPMFNHQQLL